MTLTTPVIRAALPADVEAMHALDLLCFDEPFRFDLRSMRRFATQPGTIALIAESEAGLAAFVIVTLRRRKTLLSAYITTLDVHPAHRRTGLARRLLYESERLAMAAGATEIRLHVHTENLAAICFYQSAAYRQLYLTEDYYGSGLHAWIFAKPLMAH